MLVKTKNQIIVEDIENRKIIKADINGSDKNYNLQNQEILFIVKFAIG